MPVTFLLWVFFMLFLSLFTMGFFFFFLRTWGVGQDFQILVEHLKCEFWQNLDSLIQEGKRVKNCVRKTKLRWTHLVILFSWFNPKVKLLFLTQVKGSETRGTYSKITLRTQCIIAENHLPLQGDRMEEEREGRVLPNSLMISTFFRCDLC